ncbi:MULTISPECIES: ABC transporter substrate-binding protein [Vibrio]|uniref:ABC transporter substrate-binding protein n=1 Tax=Vibrio ostreae TaxID=2841925 RepID=A0A975UA62_9VIBR|nr:MULTISPECIES: ABC transporter substrate-binding protein [Vibrio]QXO16769.1 ABC transporter substrate-binding protein [Vibrio ostreae]WGY46249.1 ABC transporter substrate-binding protein [Vibrio sp. ABG19]
MKFKLLIAAVVTSLISWSVQAEIRTIEDVLGREININVPAKRVVLGFYAEDYIAVGTDKALDNIVGISKDTWQVWRPASWKQYVEVRPDLDNIVDVGEVEAQTFSIEKVISLKPDVVVLADWQYKGLGFDIDRLEDAGIPVVVLDYNAQTLERHIKSTLVIGELTNQIARSKQIADEYQSAIEDIQSRIKKSGRPKPRVYVEFGNKGPSEYSFTYGKNMWGAMLDLAGAENIAAPFVEWWGPINPEQVIASKPEVIFIAGTENVKQKDAMTMGEGISHEQAQLRLAGFSLRPGWSSLPAVKNGRIHGVYQGASRSIIDYTMIQYLAKSLYPGLFEDLQPEKNYLNFYEKYLPVNPHGTFTIDLDGTSL